jgi:hypothetical protein
MSSRKYSDNLSMGDVKLAARPCVVNRSGLEVGSLGGGQG